MIIFVITLELCHPATGGVDGEGESSNHHDSDGFLCKVVVFSSPLHVISKGTNFIDV